MGSREHWGLAKTTRPRGTPCWLGPRARYSAGALADSPTENSTQSLLVLFAVIVIDLIGFGIVVPILPYYAKSLDASPATLGFLLAVYPAFQFVFSPSSESEIPSSASAPALPRIVASMTGFLPMRSERPPQIGLNTN